MKKDQGTTTPVSCIPPIDGLGLLSNKQVDALSKAQEGPATLLQSFGAMLRLPDTKAKVGHRSNASVYNDVKAGLLTRPVRIGQRAVAWPDYEVVAVCAARIAGQTDDQIRELVQRLHAKRTELLAAI